MFKFDKLFLTMEEKGVSTYKLREECGIDSKTVRRAAKKGDRGAQKLL